MQGSSLPEVRFVAIVSAMLLASGVACTPKGPPKKDPASLPGAQAGVAPRTPIVVMGTVGLIAQRMSVALRDGTASPMWGYCATGACSTSWAPGPTIVAAAGSSLTISLTNQLPVPTSLVVLGQSGGGLGAPTKVDSPAHPGQNYTTFPVNAPVSCPYTSACTRCVCRIFGRLRAR